MKHLALAAVLAVSGVQACAPAGSGPGTASRRDLLTADELASVPHLTLYQALERLRPRWLQVRRAVSARDAAPQRARVVVDGIPVGGLEYLRQIRASEVRDVRFRNAADATSRYGTGYVVGVVEVRTKREPSPARSTGAHRARGQSSPHI